MSRDYRFSQLGFELGSVWFLPLYGAASIGHVLLMHICAFSLPIARPGGLTSLDLTLGSNYFWREWRCRVDWVLGAAVHRIVWWVTDGLRCEDMTHSGEGLGVGKKARAWIGEMSRNPSLVSFLPSLPLPAAATCHMQNFPCNYIASGRVSGIPASLWRTLGLVSKFSHKMQSHEPSVGVWMRFQTSGFSKFSFSLVHPSHTTTSARLMPLKEHFEQGWPSLGVIRNVRKGFGEEHWRALLPPSLLFPFFIPRVFLLSACPHG